MKKATSVLWGISLIAAGVVFALKALDITSIDIFFDGWWTLFLIIPCGVGLFTEKSKSGNLFGLALGVFLLLCARDVLQYDLFWKLFIPAMIVLAGLKLVFSGLFRKSKRSAVEIEINVGGSNTAIFGGRDIRYAGEKFTGTQLTCIFGGIDCDLTNAVIEQDCAIDVSCIFGGVDLRVPPNVNVQTDIAGIFGGVDNKTVPHPNAPTLYIRGACVFGGMDIF